MKLFILIAFIISFNIFAQDSLDNITVSREEIGKSLEIMRNDGRVSEADYLKTKKELGLMNQGQIDSVTKKAVGIVKKNPDQAEGLDNLSK